MLLLNIIIRSLSLSLARNALNNNKHHSFFLLMTVLLPLLRLSSSSIFLSTISRHYHLLHKSSSLLFLSQHHQQQLSYSSSSALLIMPHDHHHPWSSSINNRRYSSHNPNPNPKPKLVVIMGPTGSGKSRLSIHLATRFFPTAEIINSDKIQVYTGLDITTNKIPIHQQLGVTHHLLGHFHPSHSRPEFTPSDFRAAAASAISLISNRRNLPLLVGGSNSFIYALIADHHDPSIDIFNLDHQQQQQSPIDSTQRYHCCFIRMDVSFPVLNRYLVKRVDDMMGSGMLEELLEFFKSKGFLGEEEAPVGLRKAIGVAELEAYFRDWEDPVRRRRALEEGIGKIKRNTCELARRQVDKTRTLRDGAGWEMHRVDGTEALRAMIAAEEGRCSGEEATEIWESQVLEPSVKIVKQFLDE